MNRSIRVLTVFTVVVLSVSSAFAADTLRSRYLVGVDGPAWAFEGAVRRERSFFPFHHVNAFAAELTDEQVVEMENRPDVVYVEPDYERHALGERSHSSRLGPGPWTEAATSTQTVQYGVQLTRAQMVWPLTQGAGVKVGVIDTGIDINHPDLVDRYRGGYDFVNNDDTPQDDEGHGTHVSGIIAASDNDIGVVGVAPAVDLYALKVLDNKGNGSSFAIIKALEWAIDNHLDVVNLSLGGGSFSTTENSEFNKVVAAGIVCVAAAGNNYPNTPTIDYPAAYDAVIAVGALDPNEAVADFSQRGQTLELMGAGVNVESTIVYPNAYQIAGDGFSTVVGMAMDYSPTPDSVSGNLVSSGIGNPGDFPEAVSGNVALIERGTLTFKDKVTNAVAAGADAAIIYNNVSGSFLGTLCSDSTGNNCSPPNTPSNPILTVSLSQGDGQTLVAHDSTSVTMTRFSESTYGQMSGTSMAAPHVTGIVALLKAVDPAATPASIREAMDQTADDLGSPGFDTTYGYGLADAYAAARYLAPGVIIPSTPIPREHPVRRPGSGG